MTKEGNMTGMALREFWRNWVYDSRKTPIEWKRHPHCAFKIIARLAGVSLGSMAPLGLILLRSEVLSQLDKGTFNFDLGALVAALVAVGIWLPSFIAAVVSAQKTLMRYVYLGSIAPANLTVFFLWIQGID